MAVVVGPPPCRQPPARPERWQLWSKIAHDMKEIRVKSNQGIVGAVATSGKTTNIEDAYKDHRFNRRIDAATGYRTRQILCVPIKDTNAEVVGVVQCINKTTSSLSVFTKEDEHLVEELCWQTSCAGMPRPHDTRSYDAALPPTRAVPRYHCGSQCSRDRAPRHSALLAFKMQHNSYMTVT